jgi:hypothetical protein
MQWSSCRSGGERHTVHMSGVEIITDDEALSSLRRDAGAGARLLFAGYDRMMEGTDPLRELRLFVNELHVAGYTNPRSAVAEVHKFWIKLAGRFSGRVLRVEEDIDVMLNDATLFGRSLEETSDSFYAFYRAPGWYELGYALIPANGQHAPMTGVLCGTLLAGDILARWSESDPNWAISQNAVRAWLMSDEKSEQGVAELVARVESALSLLSHAN